jgi:hypothetical protein
MYREREEKVKVEARVEGKREEGRDESEKRGREG